MAEELREAVASGKLQQQDAEEFCTYFLNEAHEELRDRPCLFADVIEQVDLTSDVSEGQFVSLGQTWAALAPSYFHLPYVCLWIPVTSQASAKAV